MDITNLLCLCEVTKGDEEEEECGCCSKVAGKYSDIKASRHFNLNCTGLQLIDDYNMI